MIRRKIVSATASKDVVIKLRTTEEAKKAVRELSLLTQSRSTATRTKTLRQFLSSKAVESVTPVFPTVEEESKKERKFLSVDDEEAPSLSGLNVVRLQKGEDVFKAAQTLSEDDFVEYAHPIRERYLMSPKRRRRRSRGRQATDLEPLEHRQWAHRMVALYGARKLEEFKEATDISIAVIDSGVDSSHPDLDGVVSDERTFTTGPLRDRLGHGTHVIGIIAAIRNQIGIAGLCQSRNVMSLKALGPYNGPGYYRALRYATDQGAQVVNMSLGGGYDQTEELLVKRALRKGVIFVAAMGNEFREGNPTSYPAAIDGVIAVGASTKSDDRARFSNTGRHIDLVAPGVEILSSVPTYNSELTDLTDYDSWDGTSMASPFVSAAVGLLLAKEPGADRVEIRRALVRGVDRVPGQRGFSRQFGCGRLNVRRALRKIRPA